MPTLEFKTSSLSLELKAGISKLQPTRTAYAQATTALTLAQASAARLSRVISSPVSLSPDDTARVAHRAIEKDADADTTPLAPARTGTNTPQLRSKYLMPSPPSPRSAETSHERTATRTCTRPIPLVLRGSVRRSILSPPACVPRCLGSGQAVFSTEIGAGLASRCVA